MQPTSTTEPTRTDREPDTREAKPLALDAELMEERIAPGVSVNRCETLLRLDAEAMEERIAPGITLNRCETLLSLDAEEVEERIAPGISINRCETFLGEM